jgi:hypothetical protein
VQVGAIVGHGIEYAVVDQERLLAPTVDSCQSAFLPALNIVDVSMARLWLSSGLAVEGKGRKVDYMLIYREMGVERTAGEIGLCPIFWPLVTS